MILLAGIPSESPIRLVTKRLEALGAPTVFFNQRQFATARLGFAIERGHLAGELVIEGKSHRLEDFTGVYLRLMDDRELPELADLPEGSETRLRCRALHETLVRWAEITPARVVNRLAAMGSNFSKPYQAQLIKQAGFETPETLITNDPEAVRAFRKRHGRIIYKSISGIRSIVKELTDEDDARLDHIRWCPTQFQRKIEGTNVRVHTIGREVFSTAIETTGTDYRYAHQDPDGETTLREMELPASLRERAVSLVESLKLDFAGIDLMLTADGTAYCFEVNPCPAFSYYESHTGQPIASAVARYLARLN